MDDDFDDVADDILSDADEPEFKAERSAYERSGVEDPFSSVFSKPEPTDEKEHITWVKGLNKRERFYYILKTKAIPQIEEAFPGQINKQLLVDKTMDLDGLEYKNPWAFLLGFIASQGGQKLDKQKVLGVISKVPISISSAHGITPPDIIRYSRYWSKFIV